MTWADPDDQQLFWLRDVMHNPYPITPLNATLLQPTFAEGSSRAIGALQMPIAGLKITVQHGYVYLAPVPLLLTTEQLQARLVEMQRVTMELGATVLRDWRHTFEPRVLEICEAVLAYDYRTPSLREVARFITSFYGFIVELYDIHMRVNIPPMNAVFGMEHLLTEVVGEERLAEARLLLQGFDNKSVETGMALWPLSR